MLNKNEHTRRANTDDSLLALDSEHRDLWTKIPVGCQADPKVSGL